MIITEYFNAVPRIIKCAEQCKVCMQIALVKAKSLCLSCDSGSLHVNVEEKWRDQLSQDF